MSELEAFFKAHDAPAAKMAIRQTLEAIRLFPFLSSPPHFTNSYNQKNKKPQVHKQNGSKDLVMMLQSGLMLISEAQLGTETN